VTASGWQRPGMCALCMQLGGGIAPTFAQQSICEMTHTERIPQQVMDDATWGLFSEGWQIIYDSDADILMTIVDIDSCLAAGFTLFTIDPGAHV
jgi:hypothetical protein